MEYHLSTENRKQCLGIMLGKIKRFYTKLNRSFLCLCLKTSLSAKLFIWKWFCMQFHFPANQSHFDKNGFTLRLALKLRRNWGNSKMAYCYQLDLQFRSPSVNHQMEWDMGTRSSAAGQVVGSMFGGLEFNFSFDIFKLPAS